MWKAMNVFIDQVRRLYNDWDIRVMVLLSLLLQVLLQLLGNRRKFSHSVWLRIIVWFSYVTVDSIAIFALGTISTKIGRIDDLSHLDGETKLNALWAPCLLVLLGGPDSITAYSVEDNQLWLRHLVVLVAQTSVAGYVCFLAWASDCLSYLSLLLLVAGVIKYGERVLVLWQVSLDKLRNASYTAIQDQENYMQVNYPHNPSHDELITYGYILFRVFKRVFLNQKVNRWDIDNSKEKFNQLTPQEAFKMIEIELGFMYDLLHTKAKTTYTCWGLCRRLMTSAISCIVLAVFSWFVNQTPNYPRINVAVTFVLLTTNISSEIYWVFMLLASDWAEAVWFVKRDVSCFSKLWINNKNVVRNNALLQLCKQPRWTNSAGQLNFFSLFWNFDESPSYCCLLLRGLHLHEKVGPYYYTQYQEITDYIKDQILCNIKVFGDAAQLFRNSKQLHNELLKYGCIDAAPVSQNIELMHQEGIIMTWHIATELCYYYDDEKSSSPPSDDEREAAIFLSRYMFYLYVTNPVMLQLQSADANIKFQQVRHVALERFLGEMKRGPGAANLNKSDVEKLVEVASNSVPIFDEDHAHGHPLRPQYEETRLRLVSDKLFRNACDLARKLINSGENTSNSAWTLLLKTWIAHLIYAAYNCREEYHTQQLRRGGEFLTHVWMLLVHLGVTDHELEL